MSRTGERTITELRLNTSAVTWRLVDGEVLALEFAGAQYLTTNATGARLWEALSGGATREALVQVLVTEFDVTAAEAGAGVDGFVSELGAHGLLET